MSQQPADASRGMSDPRSTAFATLVAASLKDDVLTLIDVGCSSGIDPAWRLFGSKLRAFAFDPNTEEVRRLRECETLPGIQYVAAFVGLPPDDPAAKRLRTGRFVDRSPWRRFSSYHTKNRLIRRAPNMSNVEKTALNSWQQVDLADPRESVVLSEFFPSHGVADIDFVKIDVDGADFLILRSVLAVISELQVLGLKIEVNFFGSEHPDNHTFHNVDRLMKSAGFELFQLSTRPYSVEALPAPFQLTIPAQTEWGRVSQGDAVYFRDVLSPMHKLWAEAANPFKLLKLAALYSMFGLPDCAAEVLLTHRSKFEGTVDVEAGLNALTAQVAPDVATPSYAEYIAEYENGGSRFWPARYRTPDKLENETEGKLKEAEREVERLHKEVARILRSRSWQVTAPLRYLGSLFRKVIWPRSAE